MQPENNEKDGNAHGRISAFSFCKREVREQIILCCSFRSVSDTLLNEAGKLTEMLVVIKFIYSIIQQIISKHDHTQQIIRKFIQLFLCILIFFPSFYPSFFIFRFSHLSSCRSGINDTIHIKIYIANVLYCIFRTLALHYTIYNKSLSANDIKTIIGEHL